MLITTITTIIMCLHIHSTVAVQDYITNYRNITVSSVLQYNNHNYDPWNVVDKSHGTLPDDCECCWSSTGESKPTILLQLHHPTVIGFIEILGRTNSLSTDYLRLSGINILIDGQNRNTYKHYDSSNNKVTVRMPPERASNITINRPKTSGVWILTICEIKAYRSVNIADRASITVSSTLTYGNLNYKSENVIDGSSQTNPDVCGCCWSSQNDVTPKLSLLLKESTPVAFIEIIGRSDRTDAPWNLSGTSIIGDGADKSHVQTMERNTVYLALPPSTPVQNITVLRQRPTGTKEWYLAICEIKVFSLDLNIFAGDRQNMSISQSSIFEQIAGSFDPQNAVDGKDNYDIDHCDCCSVTDNPGQWSWWQIDLGQQYLIQGIQIYGRSSRENQQLQNAVIYAGNTSLIQNQQDGVDIYTVPTMNATTRHFTKILDEAIISQYFLVKLDQSILTLCEFKLLQEVCDIHRFGFGCSHICHCFDNKTCNSASGECKTAGCYAGWNGTACDQACDYGKYGQDCTETCGKCRDIVDCNTETGHCSNGCQDNWYGAKCKLSANLLYHLGGNVSTNMSSVFNGMIPRYAINDWDGIRDPDTCQCCSRTLNAQLSWWKLDLQNIYPLKELHVYGTENERVVNQLSGFSVFLANGTNEEATLVFTDKTSTDNNEGQHIIDLSNHLARVVTIQRFGTLTLCNVSLVEGECTAGYFEDHCTEQCHCADRKPCDRHSGHCQFSVCKLGWTGPSCNTECPSQTFGEDCNNACFCKDDTCTKDYGICSGECQSGFKGVHCDEEVNENLSGGVGKITGIAGGCFGAILVVILIVVFIRRYRIYKREQYIKENYVTPDRRAVQSNEIIYDTIDADAGLRNTYSHVPTKGNKKHQCNIDLTGV